MSLATRRTEASRYGLDRFVILVGADSLRKGIPFPKTAKAIDLMTDTSHPRQR